MSDRRRRTSKSRSKLSSFRKTSKSKAKEKEKEKEDNPKERSREKELKEKSKEEIIQIKSEYELIEFNHYVDNISSDTQISVIEFLLNAKDMEYLEDELSDIFAIVTDKQAYVFSGYEVSECYEDENGLIKEVAAIIGITASSFLIGGGASTIAIGTLTVMGITASAPLTIFGLAAYGITGIFTAKKLGSDIEEANLRNKVDEKFINEDYIVYDE